MYVLLLVLNIVPLVSTLDTATKNFVLSACVPVGIDVTFPSSIASVGATDFSKSSSFIL